MNYKETIQLPHTNFPMQAELPEREPEILKYWEEIKIYEKIQETRTGKKEYILHDGPPYADEHTHIGTALNRILKDIIVKSKTLEGYRVPFTPGWDCHGMPIEHKVVKELKGKQLTAKELRKHCKEFAQKFINIQREEFMRLGEFGDWENPYITMDLKYEAKVIGVFKTLVEEGYIYRDRRPVHWCTECKTALAEAELEYQDISSPSIYVKFRTDAPNLFILIWTTTPWTIPANVAVAVNPELKYDFIRIGKERFIIAQDLRERTIERLKMKDERLKIEKTVKGKELAGLKYYHPLYDKECPVVLSNFVSRESGTGCVHIAPGHGYEDYQIGIEYKLPMLSPVDEEGRFTHEVPEFNGQYVFDADKHIIEALKKRDSLLCQEELSHSYPHCWRCNSPLIFRATPQWFLRIDHNELRDRCINEIEKVNWLPKWSKERILHSIKERPEWCISRQRNWGIPIPALYCKKCNTPILDVKLVEQAKEIIEKEGSEGWFDEAEEKFSNYSCPKCGANEFIKEKDIFDVWFDSSSSWTVIQEQNLFPADLYCEAVDQHRGWFQHSLLLSMIARKAPAFKAVLTHGLILDKEMRKMSKSLGNIILPSAILEKHGADILRLYFASLDYTTDLPFAPDSLEAIGTAYRKLRNVFRFLLGNLYDFPAHSRGERPFAPTGMATQCLCEWENKIPYHNLLELDRLMLHRLTRLIEKVRAAYSNFEFYKVYHLIHDYCVLDLSKFYLDILKDRLYTYGKTSLERRSAQTVLHETLVALVKLMAPIIPFTAEEAWQHISEKRKTKNEKQEASIHVELFPEPRSDWIDEELAKDYELLESIRADILLGLESARTKKLIGNTLDAKVSIWTEDETLRGFLEKKLALLPSIFIVSQVKIEKLEAMTQFKKVATFIDRVCGKKCERCWIRSEEVGVDKDYPTICPKCVRVLEGGNYGS